MKGNSRAKSSDGAAKKLKSSDGVAKVLKKSGASKTGKVVRLPRREKLALCIICDRMVNTGITVLGHRICSRCEKELVNLPVEDPVYDEYMSRLKGLWPSLIGEIYRY